jgi:hypothetical protein
LWVIVAVVAIGSLGYYLFNQTIGNNSYCQSLKKQKNISSDYSCKITKEYQQDGKTYIDMTVERPNKDFEDRASYTMQKDNKTIK